ncbi:MAG TPA: prepilin-type N-terminal cleavage/methylation domain-containing protein [Terriglobia bacterium]|nr:prepilin-type N-terminal cleavage/methylation domain-containing protein [Terriglobia bacterium]
MRRNSKGFSLIELLIVVAIILIIAAIAIPDLLKSRQAANQASAVGSLRTINTSEVTYSSTYTDGFSGALAYLGPPAAPPDNALGANLIDSILAGAIKSNYQFNYTPIPAAPGAQACAVNPGPGTVTQGAIPAVGTNVSSYEISASPFACAVGNGNYYFSDQSGVIRQNNTAPAGPTDSPLAG